MVELKVPAYIFRRRFDFKGSLLDFHIPRMLGAASPHFCFRELTIKACFLTQQLDKVLSYASNVTVGDDLDMAEWRIPPLPGVFVLNQDPLHKFFVINCHKDRVELFVRVASICQHIPNMIHADVATVVCGEIAVMDPISLLKEIYDSFFVTLYYQAVARRHSELQKSLSPKKVENCKTCVVKSSQPQTTCLARKVFLCACLL